MRANPLATLLVAVSAVLIVVGRVNRHQSWGDPVFVVGVALIVVAGALVLLTKR